MKIAINTRSLLSNLTGVQRYVLEILKYSDNHFIKYQPYKKLKNGYSQIWEQAILPLKLSKSQLLFSPGNTGPVIRNNQILTVHDISPIEHPEWFSIRYSNYYKLLYSILIPRVKHIIAVSDYTKKRIIEIYGIEPSKVSVIYNGANIFTLLDEDIEIFTKYLEQNGVKKGKYILSVGSIEPRKNTKNLIEAWRIAKKKLDDDYKLIICGERGRIDIFNETGFDETVFDGIVFTGRVSDSMLSFLYMNALLFIYISHYEGFGLPIIEAMKHGVPVISSSIEVFCEIGSTSQYFVDQNSVISICNGILNVINDNSKRSFLIKEGYRNSSRYCWQKCSKETIDLLENHR